MLDKLTALQASVRALGTAISDALTKKLGITATAADSTKLGGKTFTELTATTQGLSGEAVYVDKDNTSMSFKPSALLTEFRKAPSDAEITRMKTNVQLMSEVFSKWKRTSHGTNGLFPSNPAELTSWTYDPVLDKIACSINSGTVLGLISPYSFDEYTFDVVLSSTNNDDDSMGLILAFKVVDGKEHTLVAHITPGGYNWDGFNQGTLPPRFNIAINLGQSVAQGLKLVQTMPIGTLPRQTWLGADFKGGVRVRAVRNINGTMSVQVMKPDGTDFPGGEVKWTGAIPDLFLSKCPIGYYSMSQPSTTYANITVPAPKSDIIDSRNLDVHRWNNSTQTWVIPGKADAVLPKGRLYKNTEGALDTTFLTLDGRFITMGSPGSPTAVTAVSEQVTLASGVTKQYDLQTLLGASYASYDLMSADITVFAKDTNPASPLYNSFANAQALVVYGIKDGRYVVVANQSGASIDLVVKVLVSPLA